MAELGWRHKLLPAPPPHPLPAHALHQPHHSVEIVRYAAVRCSRHGKQHGRVERSGDLCRRGRGLALDGRYGGCRCCGSRWHFRLLIRCDQDTSRQTLERRPLWVPGLEVDERSVCHLLAIHSASLEEEELLETYLQAFRSVLVPVVLLPIRRRPKNRSRCVLRFHRTTLPSYHALPLPTHVQPPHTCASSSVPPMRGPGPSTTTRSWSSL